jgi:hypothetical protein
MVVSWQRRHKKTELLTSWLLKNREREREREEEEERVRDII